MTPQKALPQAVRVWLARRRRSLVLLTMLPLSACALAPKTSSGEDPAAVPKPPVLVLGQAPAAQASGSQEVAPAIRFVPAAPSAQPAPPASPSEADPAAAPRPAMPEAAPAAGAPARLPDAVAAPATALPAREDPADLGTDRRSPGASSVEPAKIPGTRLQSRPPGPFSRSTLKDLMGDGAADLLKFVRPEINVLQYPKPEMAERLRQLWHSASQRQVVIAHYGDSHVQGGPQLQMIRNELQGLAGSAGRGMIFPYALAKTYSQVDYQSAFTGNWSHASSMQTSPRVPLGVAGFAAHTTDPQASFTFSFHNLPEPGEKVTRFFYRTLGPGVQLEVLSGGLAQMVSLPGGPATSGTQVLELKWPFLSDVVHFQIHNPEGHRVEIYGVSIENPGPGILHHNLGVGGATFVSLLVQEHFENQSRQLRPDIVVLDWGTNDIIYKNTVPDDFEETVVKTLERIRAIHPQALIILPNSQAMFFKRKPITAAASLSSVLRRIAMKHDCFFYDWYRVAGGPDSMRTFYAYGLASPDHIHLSALGYAVKGQLFAQALLNTIAPSDKAPAKAQAPDQQGGRQHPHSVSAWLKSQTLINRKPDLIPAKGKPPTPAKKASSTGKRSTQKR